MEKHIEIDKDTKHKCPICDEKFVCENELKTHTNKHKRIVPETEFVCPKESCGASYETKTRLKGHINRSHKNLYDEALTFTIDNLPERKKPYGCKVCDYACNQNWILKKHMMKHTGEKPHSCQQCSYTSAHKSNLSQHMTKNHS